MAWRTELKKWIKINKLTRKQFADKVKRNGGSISSSGVSHWLSNSGRSSYPDISNTLAIEKTTKRAITALEISKEKQENKSGNN